MNKVYVIMQSVSTAYGNIDSVYEIYQLKEAAEQTKKSLDERTKDFNYVEYTIDEWDLK